MGGLSRRVEREDATRPGNGVEHTTLHATPPIGFRVEKAIGGRFAYAILHRSPPRLVPRTSVCRQLRELRVRGSFIDTPALQVRQHLRIVSLERGDRRAAPAAVARRGQASAVGPVEDRLRSPLLGDDHDSETGRDPV